MFGDFLHFLMGHQWTLLRERWLEPDERTPYYRLETFHRCTAKGCAAHRSSLVSPDPTFSGVSVPARGDYLHEQGIA